MMAKICAPLAFAAAVTAGQADAARSSSGKDRQIVPRVATGRRMAGIPAKTGELDETLARIGDMAAMPLIAQSSRDIDQAPRAGPVRAR
jgi:hypothetical protein